jgi:hypothetical protein
MSLSQTAALLACCAALAALAPRAFAGDSSVGAALGVNYGVGQSRADGYDADPKIMGLPNVSGSVMVRRSLQDWSGLRAGVRGGYVQDTVLLDIVGGTRQNGAVAIEAGKGSVLVANVFLGGTVGGEIFLAPPGKARPYFLGELGGSVMHQHVLAKADTNDNATCAISPYCEATGTEGTTGATASTKPKESARITGGPLLAIGAGVALPNPALRIELSYLHAVTMGSNWMNADDYIPEGAVSSPRSSVGIVELSVGYAFGGG